MGLVGHITEEGVFNESQQIEGLAGNEIILYTNDETTHVVMLGSRPLQRQRYWIIRNYDKLTDGQKAFFKSKFLIEPKDRLEQYSLIEMKRKSEEELLRDLAHFKKPALIEFMLWQGYPVKEYDSLPKIRAYVAREISQLGVYGRIAKNETK